MNRISILGSNISIVDSYKKVYEQLLNFLETSNKPGYVTVNNVHTVVTAVRDKKYRQIINDSYLSLPDGKPLSVLAKLKGEKNITRIFGPTVFEKTIEYGQKTGITHFFFGSTEIVWAKMMEKIKVQYTDVKIAGHIIPPFNEFTSEENEDFVRKMNDSKADIIWVSLGAPKQEKWIYENYYKLNRGIVIGIGAGFEYLAGEIIHAPKWMKNFSLEWFYRLLQNPQKLWKRYLITNTLFLYYVILDFLKLRKFD